MACPGRTRIAVAVFTIVGLAGCGLFGDGDSLTVTRYTGPELTLSDATRDWDVRIEGIHVTLTGVPRLGETSTLRLRFEHVPDALPRLKDVWHGPPEGGLGTLIREGRVEVVAWDPDRLMAGAAVVRFPMGGRTREVFWIEIE